MVVFSKHTVENHIKMRSNLILKPLLKELEPTLSKQPTRYADHFGLHRWSFCWII